VAGLVQQRVAEQPGEFGEGTFVRVLDDQQYVA
jgi:hypothetical protein